MVYSVSLLPDGTGSGSGGGGASPPFDGGVIHNPILAAAGLESAPSYSFDGQANLGMRTPGNGMLALVTQGHDALTLDGAGNLGIIGDATFGGTLYLPRNASIQASADATPQGSIIASPGSLWLGSGGGGMFYKQTGTSSSGWVPLLGPRPPQFPLSAPAGSAAAASYGFAGAAGTGVYMATGSLRLALGGSDALVLSGSGAALPAALAIGGTLDVTGATRISAPFSVSSAATLQSLVVTGSSQMQGSLSVAGNSTFYQPASFSAAVTIGSTLAVTGAAALSGPVTLAAGAQIINAAGDPRGRVSAAPGSVFLSSDGGPGLTLLVKESGLGTDGWALAGGSSGGTIFPLYAPPATGPDAVQYGFDGTRAGIYSPASEVLGLGTAGVERLRIGSDGALTVSGAAALQSSLAVTGPTQVAALGVSGSATLSGTLSAGGKATLLAGMSVSGLAALGGTLTVAGAASFAAAATFAGGASFTGTGAVNISAPLKLLGSISLQAGQSLVGGTGLPEGVVAAPVGSVFTASDTGALFVKTSGTGPTGWSQVPTGDTAANFPLLAPDGSLTAPSYSFLSNGGRWGMTMDGASALALSTDGQATLRLTAAGAAVAGGLSTAGAISATGDLGIGGNTTLSGTLGVTGASTFAAGSFSGALSAQQALTVGGGAAITGDIDGGGNIIALGDLQGDNIEALGDVSPHGRLLLATGAAASPSATFAAATGSGLFLDASHAGIGVSVAGSQVGYFSADGYVSLTGGSTPTAASVFISQSAGTAAHPAFSVNEMAGMYVDGGALGLAVGGQPQLTLGSASASFAGPLSVGGDLGITGSLSAVNAAMSGTLSAGSTTLASLSVGGAGAPAANGASVKGQLRVGGGTAAAPAYAFGQFGAAGTSTGLFYDSANSAIGVTVGGTEVGYFSGGGYVPLSGGAGITLNDLTLTSSAAKHLTLVCGGDPAKVPTLSTVGFIAGDGSTRKLWQWQMQSQGATGGTISTQYRLALGADDAQSPMRLSFDSVAGGYSILSYDDAARVTTFGGGLAATGISGSTVSASAAIRSAAGTAAGPSVTFSPSPGTGVFYDSARSGMGVTVGGVQVGVFGSGGYVPLVGSNANFTSAPVINVDSGTPQLTAGQSGAVINFTGSATVRLPAATAQVAGRYFTFMVGGDGVTPSIQVATGSGDIIHTAGGDVPDGGTYTGPAQRYAFVTVECNTAGHWAVGALQGSWGNSAGSSTLYDLTVLSTTGNNLTLDSTASAIPATLAIKSQAGQPQVLSLGSGSSAAYLLRNTDKTLVLRDASYSYDVFSYTDAAGSATARNWVFGSVNLSGVRDLSVAGQTTFAGNVTFQGGTTGLVLSPTYPLTAPTGTTAAPNVPYSFVGKTTSGMGYDTTTSVLALYAGSTAPGLTVSGGNVAVGGMAASAASFAQLTLNTPASATRYIAFLNQGANGVYAGYNNDSGGPLGFWFRATGATDAFTFTTTNGIANAFNTALRIGPNMGTSFGTSSAAPTGGVYVAGSSLLTGAVGLGAAVPTAAGVLLLASASASAGVNLGSPTIQIVTPAGSGAGFSAVASSGAPGCSFGYNEYVGGASTPVGTFIQAFNAKPLVFCIGADASAYLNVAAIAYNVANSFFWNFGAKAQSLSTVGVTGNLAVGATVAGGTAAPTNGLLVQGNAIVQGTLSVTGGITGSTTTFPLAAPTGTTAAPNIPYSFTGKTTYGMGYDATASATVLYSNNVAAVQAVGGSAAIGQAVADSTNTELALQFNAPANLSRGVGFWNQGVFSGGLSHNNFSNSSNFPVGLWLRSYAANQSLYLTTSTTAGTANYGIRVNPNGGVSVGSFAAAAPANGLYVQAASWFNGAVGIGQARPTAGGCYFLAAETAEAGLARNIVSVQAAANAVGGEFVITEAGVPASCVSYNKFANDGVPVGTQFSNYNAKPMMFCVGTSYTNIAAIAYNVANSYFWNFGNKTQSLSTVGVTGNLAIGATVAGGTAAPANGLLVQANTAMRGGLSIGPASSGTNARSVYTIESAAAESGVDLGANTVSHQISSTSMLGCGYFNTDAGATVSSFGYNKYTGDGVPAGSALSALSGGPMLFVNGPDYRQIGASFYNASNTYKWHFGPLGNPASTAASGAQGASTVSVKGNVTIGSTISGSTAAPTDGLVVQGATALQGGLVVTGNATGGTTFSFPATTYQMLASDNGATLQANTTGNYVWTLPAQITGYKVTLVNFSSGGLQVKANAANSIITPQTGLAAAANSISTTQVGATITLLMNANTNVIAVSQTGTWTTP